MYKWKNIAYFSIRFQGDKHAFEKKEFKQAWENSVVDAVCTAQVPLQDGSTSHIHMSEVWPLDSSQLSISAGITFGENELSCL